jgi:catechol 2,3-dioxygenase-like lactoylglutathione lyase family enzyme
LKILRVGFVGTRTSKVEETTSFFGDVLGLDVVRADPSWSILQLPTGRFDFFEVYGSEFDDERLAPSDESLFVAFTVEDLEDARREIVEAGAEAGDVVWAKEAFDDPDLEGYGWFFFRAPDERTYVIQQVPE